ncbi:MAG TPA: hypothetical protein VMX75_11300 [Spirochaetia bacterium]|nr:hypothetical protein [Spirochaetia bacterium]
MDTAIYLGTAALTVVWSVWTYLLWADKAQLPEDSGFRFLMMIGPTAFFILTAMSGWEQLLFLRLDLIGILALDFVTLISILALVVISSVQRLRKKGRFRLVLILYFTMASGITIFCHVIKLFPPTLLRMYEWVKQGLELDFFKFAWVGLDTQTKESDLVGMLNKIVIAVLSYIPIAMVRFVYGIHQRKKLQQEIEDLQRRIDSLEATKDV